MSLFSLIFQIYSCRLRESGAAVDKVDSTNRAAFRCATSLNHQDADVNAVGMKITVARRSEKDSLCDEDACISGEENTQDGDGSNDKMSEYTLTALQLASAYGHDLTVRLLLDNGANPKLASDKTESSLCLALFRQHVSVIRTLLKTVVLDIDIQYFLHTAIQVDDTDIMKLLLEIGGFVAVEQSLFYALLTITSDSDIEDKIIPFLLKQGVPYN